MISTPTAVAAGLVGALISSAVQAQDRARYISAAQVRAGVATTTHGVAGAPIPTGPGATILVAHRTQTGEVEVHTGQNDEIIAREGTATVLVGGEVEGHREVSPGEWRGGTITGGTRYDLAPGDMLWIPAGQAHQILVPSGASFIYVAVKFPAQPAP